MDNAYRALMINLTSILRVSNVWDARKEKYFQRMKEDARVH
jgi:hypothetical protein